MPVQLVAHHPKLLWGYGQMEQSLASSQLVGVGLKDLGQLRVATLVGRPFRIDIGLCGQQKEWRFAREDRSVIHLRNQFGALKQRNWFWNTPMP